MLYRLIKNKQVDLGTDKYEVPIAPISRPNKDFTSDSPQTDESLMLDEARDQASTIIGQAKAKVATMLEEAKSEAELLLKKAEESGQQKGYDKGCQEGYKAGSKEALDKYQVQLDNARQVVASAHTESRQVITKTRDEIVDLAVSIAASIVKYSIDTRDEGIIEMVKVALQRAEEMKMILFRCSPKTILMLKASEHEFKAICPNAVFSFIEDKSVNDMGCIIETEEQVLDLEIDGQLQKVTDALRGMGDNNEP